MDKTKILFLSADPSDAGRLRLSQELRDIREKLQLSKQRDIFHLEPREAVRPGDISQAIFDVEPQIVHFSGHGTSTGELCFENITGQVQPVAPSALSSLFELVSQQVKCVVLNACYSEIQAKAIADHIPYVIGMNQAIGDTAAIAFSVGFYRALGYGHTFETAYKFACVEIQLEGIPEYLTPVIYTKKVENTKTDDVVSLRTKSSFTYTSITIKQDRSLFLQLLEDFPPNGRGARFLKEHDVGNSIRSKDLESIDYLIDTWADVMHEFVKKAEGRGQRAEGSNMVWASDPHQLQSTKSEILVGDLNPCSLRSRAEDRNHNSLLPSASCPLPFLLNPELEEKRINFMNILIDFQSELNVNIWPVEGGEVFSMYLHDFEVREHRLEARDKLNKMATQAFELYEDLLRCCRITLGTVDDEQ